MIKNILKVVGIVGLILFTSLGVTRAECVSPNELHELLEEVQGTLVYNLHKGNTSRLLEEMGFEPKVHNLSQIQVYGGKGHDRYMVVYYKDNCVHSHELISKDFVNVLMRILDIRPLTIAEFN